MPVADASGNITDEAAGDYIATFRVWAYGLRDKLVAAAKALP